MHLHPLPRPLLALLAGTAVTVLAVGAAACGDDDEPTGTAGTDTTASDGTEGGDGGGEAADGTIVATDFSLTDITVAPGGEIVLENQGDVPHTATADDGAFDLGRVSPGDSSAPDTAPDEPGSYAFHCEIHGQMTATLTVEG